jgi:hypothetical protein
VESPAKKVPAIEKWDHVGFQIYSEANQYRLPTKTGSYGIGSYNIRSDSTVTLIQNVFRTSNGDDVSWYLATTTIEVEDIGVSL